MGWTLRCGRRSSTGGRCGVEGRFVTDDGRELLKLEEVMLLLDDDWVPVRMALTLELLSWRNFSIHTFISSKREGR